MSLIAADIVKSIFTTIVPDVVKRVLPDQDKHEAVQAKTIELQDSAYATILEKQIELLITQVKSDSWYSAIWRPISLFVLSLTLSVLLINFHIIAPYLNKSMPPISPLVLEGLFGLVGGAVVLRSVIDKWLNKWKS